MEVLDAKNKEIGDAVDSHSCSVSKQILEEIFKHRVVLNDSQESDREQLEACNHHLERIASAINRKEPIRMLLPAFPGKSPNRRKTLGSMPDLAENLAINKLTSLCDSIKSIYKYGAKIIICSDGYCFADIVHISDDDIREYSICLKDLISKFTDDGIGFYDLTDAFDGVADMNVLREELMITSAESLASLRSRCREDLQLNAMYKGITRFLLEDYMGLSQYANLTKTAIQKQAKKNSYRVIQRSNAWSRLIEQNFPGSVRLSIHPQYSSSKKIGISLVDAEDNWLTPWHSVAIKDGDDIRLVKRSDIDESKYALVFSGGRPSHFQALGDSSR